MRFYRDLSTPKLSCNTGRPPARVNISLRTDTTERVSEPVFGFIDRRSAVTHENSWKPRQTDRRERYANRRSCGLAWPYNCDRQRERESSILATYRDTDQQLMNVCLQRFEQQQEEKALGVGTFLYESVKSYPTRYEGWMIRISEGIYRKQVAERIPESTIASNQRKFGNEWIVRTIEQYQDRKLAPSPLVS